MNSVTLQRDIEVDQKAQIPTTREQVGKKVCVMKRRQAIDGLKLYHHRLGNNQVHAMATIQSEAFVSHRKLPLTDERHSSKLKFVA